MKTVVLLIISNLFMTIAWYGHLKFQNQTVAVGHRGQLDHRAFRVHLSSAGEPARLADLYSDAAKIMQECITLVVFTVVAYLLFGETLKWNNAVAYALLVLAVFFSFRF